MYVIYFILSLRFPSWDTLHSVCLFSSGVKTNQTCSWGEHRKWVGTVAPWWETSRFLLVWFDWLSHQIQRWVSCLFLCHSVCFTQCYICATANWLHFTVKATQQTTKDDLFISLHDVKLGDLELCWIGHWSYNWTPREVHVPNTGN